MKRLVLLAVVLAANPIALGGDKAGKAEAEWAKGVATDYLKAARNVFTSDSPAAFQARQLLTVELRKQYEKAGFPQPGRGYIRKWEFSKDKISPDKTEVVLEGTLSTQQGERHFQFEFTVRVVKSKDSGLWRIDYFLFEEKSE